MKYREFLSLTDEEIKFILMDLFKPVKIENIQRDKHFNEITLDMTTDGWQTEETKNFEITDTVVLTTTYINGDFSIEDADIIKWRQFLLAKGVDALLKDNPYLEN